MNKQIQEYIATAIVGLFGTVLGGLVLFLLLYPIMPHCK